jgi:ribosome maturation protein Sdo1
MHFTPQERGKCKHKFTRRNRAWDIIRTVINKGHSAQTAIDRIYPVYGRGMTVTTILNRIAIDRRNNTLHPDFIA